MKVWTSSNADVAPQAKVECLPGGRPRYKWTCLACGTGKRFHSRAAAEDQSWAHYTHAPCEGIDPAPPSTLSELGLTDYRKADR